MTTEQRQELEELRELYEVLTSAEQISHVLRLVELERMDAAQKPAREREKLIALVRKCGAYSWTTNSDYQYIREEGAQWHNEAVALLKEIGAWK